jgi:hypothetical protein
MGAIMLAATLIGRADQSIDFKAGYEAVETLDFAEHDENAVQELLFEYEEVAESIMDDARAARTALRTAVNDLEDAFTDGSEITFHTYGAIDVYITGGPSSGDASAAQRAMWTIQNFPSVRDALGFVQPDRIYIKED